MKLSLIVAMAENRVIGRDNGLPWRLSADLRRFRRLTMGHHLIVGRKTWDSIGRPLPGRKMVVVSRSTPDLPEEVRLAGSFGEATDLARRAGEDEAFVGGGAEIYRLALPTADRVYLTRVHTVVADGDAYFPPLDPGDWTESAPETHAADERNDHAHTFSILDRRR